MSKIESKNIYEHEDCYFHISKKFFKGLGILIIFVILVVLGIWSILNSPKTFVDMPMYYWYPMILTCFFTVFFAFLANYGVILMTGGDIK